MRKRFANMLLRWIGWQCRLMWWLLQCDVKDQEDMVMAAGDLLRARNAAVDKSTQPKMYTIHCSRCNFTCTTNRSLSNYIAACEFKDCELSVMIEAADLFGWRDGSDPHTKH